MNPMSTQFLPAVTQEQFEAMTIPQRWVAVAKDVLAQLGTKRIKAVSGVWCEGESEGISRDVLTGATPPVCHVCGVGAAFVSLVRLGNQFSGRADLGLSDIYPLFKSLLGEKQMWALEYAFENGSGFVDSDGFVEDDQVLTENEMGSLAFKGPYGTESRLRAIMQRIIDNGGYLIPNEAS